jgi:hypothetical protein
LRSSNPLADKFLGLADYRNMVLDVLQLKVEGALKNGKGRPKPSREVN